MKNKENKEKADEYRDPVNPSGEILINSHFLPPVLEREQSEAMPSSPFNLNKFNKVGIAIDIDTSTMDQAVDSTNTLNPIISTTHRVHACLLIEDETLNNSTPPVPCIVCCGDDIIIHLYNVNNGQIRRKYSGSSEGFLTICLSPFCMSNSSDQRSRSNSNTSIGSYRSSATNNSEMPKSGVLQYLVGGGINGGLYIWDFHTAMVLQYINTSGIPHTPSISDSNLQVDSISSSIELPIEPNTNTNTNANANENTPIYGVSLYMKRSRLHVVTCSDNACISSWDIISGDKSHNLLTPIGENIAVSTKKNGYKVNTITILDPQQLKQSKNIAFVSSNKKGNTGTATTPKLPVLLFAGGEDKKIHIWNAVSNEYIKSLIGHTNDITAIAAYFQSTTNALNTLTNQEKHEKLYNAMIISGSKDHSVRVWDMNSGSIIHLFDTNTGSKGHNSPITGVSYIFGGSNPTIISSSEDGIVKTWHSINGRLMKTFNCHKDYKNANIKFNNDKNDKNSKYNTKLSGFSTKKGLLRGDPFKVIIGLSSWNKHIIIKELDTTIGSGCTIS